MLGAGQHSASCSSVMDDDGLPILAAGIQTLGGLCARHDSLYYYSTRLLLEYLALFLVEAGGARATAEEEGTPTTGHYDWVDDTTRHDTIHKTQRAPVCAFHTLFSHHWPTPLAGSRG